MVRSGVFDGEGGGAFLPHPPGPPLPSGEGGERRRVASPPGPPLPSGEGENGARHLPPDPLPGREGEKATAASVFEDHKSVDAEGGQSQVKPGAVAEDEEGRWR